MCIRTATIVIVNHHLSGASVGTTDGRCRREVAGCGAVEGLLGGVFGVKSRKLENSVEVLHRLRKR